MAAFWSGFTRPKTVVVSMMLGQLLAASGRVRASTACSAPSTPALAAMVATVAGLSPEMTLICTPCLRK